MKQYYYKLVSNETSITISTASTPSEAFKLKKILDKRLTEEGDGDEVVILLAKRC